MHLKKINSATNTFLQVKTDSKILVILIPAVNFIKNFKPKTQLCNFCHPNIGAKCAHKMLMKSIPELPC